MPPSIDKGQQAFPAHTPWEEPTASPVGTPSASPSGPSPQPARNFGEPRACNGYYADTREWGDERSIAQPSFRCPDGWAVVGVDSGPRSISPTPFLGVDCCPLPEGTLTEERIQAAGSCPDGYVVTGLETYIQLNGKSSQDLSCSKLAAPLRQRSPQGGQSFNSGPSTLGQAMMGRADSPIARSSLPVSVRYGIRRSNRTHWGSYGCVGRPAGAVLVGRSSGTCRGIQFAEIEEPDGAGGFKTMKILPDCAGIDGPFEATPKCIKGE